MTADDVRQLMRHAIADAGGKQNAWAAQLQVKPAFVSAILTGKKSPSGAVLTALGLKRVERYEVVK